MSSTALDFVGPMHPTSDNKELRGYLGRAAQAIREAATVAGALRIGGAGLMVFSLSLFLIQGMEAISDLYRYLLLLGQTMLLTAAGFAVGLLLKEPRGARVFFALALVSIPANFAVLGAMIYSIAPLDTVITQYPTYASWHSTDTKELLLAGIAGLVVLLPMSVFCFAVFARHSKWWLSAAYVLASASLLIPLRETFSVTLISSVCALGVLAVLSYQRIKGQRLATGEENFAKILLFIPAALMLARSAMLYSVDFHFTLAVVIAAYYLLRRVVALRTGNSALTTVVQSLSIVCSFSLSAMVASLVGDHVSVVSPILLFTLLWFALNWELTRFIQSEKAKSVIHGAWVLVCFLILAFHLSLFYYRSAFLMEITLALILLVVSVQTRQKFGIILASLALIGVFIANGMNLISMIMNAGWMGMAIAGATTIVAGSLLEKFWPALKLGGATRFKVKKMTVLDIDEREFNDSLAAGSHPIAA